MNASGSPMMIAHRKYATVIVSALNHQPMKMNQTARIRKPGCPAGARDGRDAGHLSGGGAVAAGPDHDPGPVPSVLAVRHEPESH